MTITLHGNPHSTCTRKVLLTLHEKGADFDFRHIDLMKGEQKSPEHLARQPFGVVPVLEHDGFSLYESRAIARYLDRALPGPALTPSDLHAAARMEQYISIEQSYFSGPALQIFLQKVKFPAMGQPTDSARVEEALTQLGKPSDVLAARLEETRYLAGDAFSLADAFYMPYFALLVALGASEPITSRPALTRWWTEVSERPAWKKVLEAA